MSRGQTPGKYLLKVRVVDSDSGQPLPWFRMFVREFVLKFLLMGFQSGIQIQLGVIFVVQSGDLFDRVGILFIWQAMMMPLRCVWYDGYSIALICLIFRSHHTIHA